MNKSTKLLLFDIDGTLLTMAGAGMRALGHAVREVFGFDFEGSGIRPHGRTDPLIVGELLVQKGIPLSEWPASRQSELWSLYADFFPEEIERTRSQHRLEAGVPALLETLHGDDRYRLGILTGNLHSTARLKLAHFALERYFPIGAYACDCAERGRLGPIALERARRHYGVDFQPSQTWLIGDTEHDIRAARAFGAKAMAVATGGFPLAVLQEHLPDVVLEDLSDTQAVLQALEEFPADLESRAS